MPNRSGNIFKEKILVSEIRECFLAIQYSYNHTIMYDYNYLVSIKIWFKDRIC